MSFTAGPAALLAAAIAIPALLILYFLKLKRKERKVASTLLWRKAVQDLQVNSPFQKLRKNLLLFLQLLILGALLFGLAGPVADFKKRVGRNIVILIDRSASMKSIESDNRTRLEHAKEAAATYLQGLGGQSQAMVIAFSDRAEVVCAFTNNIGRLQGRIDEIEATDGPSRIGEALQLAVAYSTRSSATTEDSTGFQPSAEEMASIELFSDGRIGDAEKEFITRGELTFHRIGNVDDNVGIVAFDLRRDIDRPGMLSVFAQIENFGPSTITTDVSLSADGAMTKVQEVTLGPARNPSSQPASGRAELASAQNMVFELENQSGGTMEIKLHRKDALASDNVVVAPLDPPRAIRILSVSDRPEIQYYMRRAFQYALEIDDFVTMSTAEYENADESEMAVDGRSAYDLIVLDKHDTDRLWPGNYVFFGGIPKIESVSRTDEEITEQVFVNWRESHPLLRHVPLDKVLVGSWDRLNLPSHAVKLVEGENSTAIAFITDPGHRYVIAAFDLLDSNLFKGPAPLVFLQNAVMYLASGGLTESGRLIHAGETIAASVPPGATEAVVVGPGSRIDKINVTDRRTMTYARTDQVGFYRSTFDDARKTAEVYAANILDPIESNVAPARELRLGGGQLVAVEEDVKVNEPLWPYAVAAALVVLMLEWWVYNRRVMI